MIEKTSRNPIRAALFYLTLIITIPVLAGFSDQQDHQIYDPDANAEAQLASAVSKARETNRHVLVKVGGNWCGWCTKLETLFFENQKINKALSENFVLVHINYSKENQNEALLSKLGYPQRFGFPVLLVLDGSGNRIHTQDTGYLEKGNNHNPDLVFRFLLNWGPDALDASQY